MLAGKPGRPRPVPPWTIGDPGYNYAVHGTTNVRPGQWLFDTVGITPSMSTQVADNLDLVHKTFLKKYGPFAGTSPNFPINANEGWRKGIEQMIALSQSGAADALTDQEMTDMRNSARVPSRKNTLSAWDKRIANSRIQGLKSAGIK